MHKFKFKLPLIIGLIGILIFSSVGIALGSVVHRVSPGENLWTIARWYNTTVNQIKTANNYWSNRITVGQQLVIPGNFKTHRVKPGDSLHKIAHRFSVSINQLRIHNGIWHNIIRSGDILTIPSSTEAKNSYAANTVPNYISDKEFDLLSRLVQAEALGESFEGKVAVAAVVLNRVEDSKFPNTISKVIYQPLAFEPVMNGRIYHPANNESIKAVEAALNGWDPTNNSLYFYNPAKVYSPYNWIWSRSITTRIDNHVFAL
ncbi:cell wall hydrolase [Acetohalobium arabaticum]|uniref:Cell wall hydrolase SleB n=1 Tax=Acetohalobium arabaticum (strain ATCC 49924 / DSM 5501 / Z-7288) TaxID=574087 RepID=D9QQ42_ACEAZ|nr:cell wall hydrolase [Acetohalobium arabaticum]ADL12633.1 cell wall hydrolase SleB [Acetohalobium arabaticum DSM 5501]